MQPAWAATRLPATRSRLPPRQPSSSGFPRQLSFLEIGGHQGPARALWSTNAVSDSWTYLAYAALTACILIAVYRLQRYRRIEKTGPVVEATVVRLATPENQSYELSHTGYVDMHVYLSMQLPDGSEIQTHIVEQFSRSHFRRVGDRLLVVVDPRNSKVVYPANEEAEARAGLSGS